MRVLGVLSDGSIGMKKFPGKYIPKNTAYLQVSAGTPDELKLMTEEEYEKAKNVKATSITLSQTSIVDATVGQQITLTATVLPENATDKSVTWSSSNTGVATVDAAGNVSILAEGSAVITATTNDGTNLSATCAITVPHVTILATNIALNKTSIDNAKVGDEYVIKATVFPENADDKSVTWSSTNPAVATVDSNGLVKILAEGSTVITATTNDGTNLSASCAITVPHVAVLATSITLSQTSIADAKVGQKITLTAIVLPEDAEDKSVTWNSSDTDVAIVDANGVVTIIGEGSAVITATTNDGTNLSATCEIKVPHVDILLGDANGDGIIDVSDITMVASYILGHNPQGIVLQNADANGDKVIDVTAITQIAKIILEGEVVLGDANGDGVVDVSDITSVAAYILGGQPEGFNNKNADANQDGTIDVSDITAIAGFILH